MLPDDLAILGDLPRIVAASRAEVEGSIFAGAYAAVARGERRLRVAGEVESDFWTPPMPENQQDSHANRVPTPKVLPVTRF